MKIKVKLKYLLLSVLLTITIPVVVVLADEYAYTQVWFNVPADVSFLIYLLGTPTNVSSLETSPGNPTTWISFNASAPTEYGIQPMTEGSTVNKQDGPTKPIVQVYNVGNTNFNFTMNATVGEACISLCANSTCPAGDCTPVSTCQNIKEQVSWVPIAYDLIPNGYANITMYADFVDCPLMNKGGTIYYRSTASSV